MGLITSSIANVGLVRDDFRNRCCCRRLGFQFPAYPYSRIPLAGSVLWNFKLKSAHMCTTLRACGRVFFADANEFVEFKLNNRVSMQLLSACHIFVFQISLPRPSCTLHMFTFKGVQNSQGDQMLIRDKVGVCMFAEGTSSFARLEQH